MKSEFAAEIDMKKCDLHGHVIGQTIFLSLYRKYNIYLHIYKKIQDTYIYLFNKVSNTRKCIYEVYYLVK